MRFLDDRLVDTLDAWLAWGGVMRLGAGTEDDAVLVATEGQIVNQASWEELAERDQDTTWEIRLVTPTTLFVEGESCAELVSCDDCDEFAAALVGVESEARSSTHRPGCYGEGAGDAGFHARVHGVAGDAAQRGPGPLEFTPDPGPRGPPAHQRRRGGPEATRVFSRLMALSAYTNVGSHTSFGMGVIDAVAA
mgnify:CR=1 FL=1